MNELAPGICYYPNYLDRAEQAQLADELDALTQAAPFFVPRMPKSGKPFSVKMTNCGSLGWVSDEKGYRYQATHPETGRPWPAIPEIVMRAWRDVGAYPHAPEACLINLYAPTARMGLHQDRDEEAFDAPVVSLSLGDSAIFRFGGTTRSGATKSLKLHSGDALSFGGPARLIFHGVDRILAATSTLLREDCRINLTLRRVTRPRDWRENHAPG